MRQARIQRYSTVIHINVILPDNSHGLYLAQSECPGPEDHLEHNERRHPLQVIP